MVSRVGKFVGGLGVDVTNVANVHATENRIALGASINPTANVHVVGNAHVSTTFSTGGNIIGGGTYTGGGLMTTGGNIVIPNDGDVGSVGATDAIQISSGGIVTFKDDIKIKDDGTIGSASAAGAMTIDSSGIVTFVDDIKIKDDGTIGSASAATAMTIDSSGIVTFVDDIKIKDGGTIGVASTADAMTVSSAGIVTFKDDILIKDGGTIGVASKADSVTLASDGKVTLVDDLAVTGNAIATLGIGAGGNTLPLSNSISIGNPANVIIQTAAGSGKSIIVGDPTGTTTHSLDIRGSANVGALTATTGTYSGRLVVDDTTEATSTTDGSLQTDGGLSVAGDAVFGDDIKLITDASVASFGVNGEITLTHVHNTGLLLEDSGGSPTLQFHDANESVSSDGSKLILTSNGVAFDLPTADGSSGQVIKTDGSGALSFTDITTDLDPATELASDTDCGTAESASDSVDAFGIAINNSFVELDLRTQGANKLGTVDMGAF